MTMFKIVKTYKKTVVVASVLSALGIIVPVQAAIPVVDTSNIAQQLKTYTETVKVVTNTAQQITLQLKELAGLPNSLLNSYKNELKKSVATVKDSLKPSGFFTELSDWDKYWHDNYPRISAGKYSETAASAQKIQTNLRETLSMNNQKAVTAYHQLMDELEKSMKRLEELLEQNKDPEGNKQAVQIANEIAAEKAHIESINTSIQALTAQNQMMKNQAEVLEKQNHQAVVEAAKQAEGEAIQKMKQEVTMNTPIIDDPFQTYGNVRW